MLRSFSCHFINGQQRQGDAVTVRTANPLDAAETASRGAPHIRYSRIEVWEGPVRVLTWKIPGPSEDLPA
jgi:hypothetical protein